MSFRPKDDKGKRKADEEVTVPEELLAALNFADLGAVPPWATDGPDWEPGNGGLTERHIQARPRAQMTVAYLFLCTLHPWLMPVPLKVMSRTHTDSVLRIFFEGTATTPPPPPELKPYCV